jgi:transcription elongation factor Elf1
MTIVMDTRRSKNAYQTYVYAFVYDIEVVCPLCGEKARVFTGNFLDFRYDIEAVKLVCTHCGHNRQLPKIARRHPHLVFGAPVDPFFHQPLWLQATFKNQHILWAYNRDHLAFIQQHIGAKLRERNGQPLRSRSIGARLPRWMTAANQREGVLKAIQQILEK